LGLTVTVIAVIPLKCVLPRRDGHPVRRSELARKGAVTLDQEAGWKPNRVISTCEFGRGEVQV